MDLQKLKNLSFMTISLAVAIGVFTLSSSYYISNNGFGIVPISYQTMIFFLLGFFHAYNVWALDNVINEQNKNIFTLFCYSLIYTAWYNVVLLPKSGLGCIEWFIVFIILTSNLITEVTAKKIRNPFMGQRPMAFIFLGALLFIIKVIIFSMVKGNNIYDSFILGNETARFICVLPIIVFCMLGIISLLSQLYKHITNNFEMKPDSFFSFIKKIIKALLTVSVTVWSPIIILIMPFILATLGALILVEMANFYIDSLHFVEDILRLITSTGELSLHPSTLYYAFQMISFIGIIFYTIYVEKEMSENIENQILDACKLETTNTKQLVYEIKQLGFNEKLRISKNTSRIKETVRNLNNSTIEK